MTAEERLAAARSALDPLEWEVMEAIACRGASLEATARANNISVADCIAVIQRAAAKLAHHYAEVDAPADFNTAGLQ